MWFAWLRDIQSGRSLNHNMRFLIKFRYKSRLLAEIAIVSILLRVYHSRKVLNFLLTPKPTRTFIMRVACLQFEPVSGDVDDNISRADAVLSRINPNVLASIDLLVLPELAFSGTLPSSENGGVERHYEYLGLGITGLWARTFALKYNCFVVIRYPEKIDKSTVEAAYYNSALIVDKEGDIVANHRKCFLYS